MTFPTPTLMLPPPLPSVRLLLPLCQPSGNAAPERDRIHYATNSPKNPAKHYKRVNGGEPGMTRSMTGFASASGRHESWSWTAEIRSVNGRGFDLKLRTPEWIEGLEQTLRPLAQSRIARGTV